MRNLIKMQKINDGTRLLFESVMLPEILIALNDLKKTDVCKNMVLIGGLALSHYVKPRMTQDIDVLIISDSIIPEEIPGFKKTRAHAFQNNETHVELQIVTPEYVNIPSPVVQHIISTAIISDEIKIASPSGLVASKLFRLSLQDTADIVNLIINCEINLTGFNLPQDKIEKYFKLIEMADKEKQRPPLGD